MFYRKNLLALEQGLRVGVGLALASVPLWVSWEYSWVLVLSGLGLAMTGVVGFCPACYLVGRREVGKNTGRLEV